MFQRLAFAIALILLGSSLVGSSLVGSSLVDSTPLESSPGDSTPAPPASDAQGSGVLLARAAGGLLIGTGLVVLFGSFAAGAERSLLPLNWFLPALRKRRAGSESNGGWLADRLRRVLPGVLFSDRLTKQRGWIRRGLRWLGFSWLLSPIRRAVQAVAFAVFLVLFFWVCWPYDARPPAPGHTSSGWRLEEIDSQSSWLRFQSRQRPSWMQAGRTVYLVQEQDVSQDSGTPVPLRIAEGDATGVSLEPSEELTDGQLERLLDPGASWTVHERLPGAWPTHYADNLAGKEWLPADLFLVIDPLVSLSTAIASRQWVWSLACAGAILLVCVLIPRGFCGYICPLGTLIDLFDWIVGRRIQRFRLPEEGWWVHIKYYLLAGTLVSAVAGVLVSGYVAAIPVITRGMLFLGEPLQTGLLRGWHQVPAPHLGHVLSIGMFLAVLGLGLLRPRFWCKYVCPSGAMFSLGNLFRVSERKVESSCIHCNKCVEVCPFDAIKPDFTTRVTDCTLCQTCGGVCPTHAIKFVERWNVVELKVAGQPPTGETPLGRRGFLSLAAGTAAAVVGGWSVAKGVEASAAGRGDAPAFLPIRPPGSVPEAEFLQMCIRCGECFKACPNNVLQAEGLQQGLAGLWTPHVVADWAGCESSCNACGQVCPTGAIRALPMDEKRVARMGLAIVNQTTCLPFANREACQLCVDECQAAGYDAIEFTRVFTQVDEGGSPIAGSGYLAPVVLAEKCVGCGLCQTRCHAINVKSKHLLQGSAIVIQAGAGREDRLLSGSYRELRRREAASGPGPSTGMGTENAGTERVGVGGDSGFFVPDRQPQADTPPRAPAAADDDPFGLGN